MTLRTTTPTRPHDIGNTRLNAEIEGWDMNGTLTDFNEIEFALDACIRRGRAIVVEKLSPRGWGNCPVHGTGASRSPSIGERYVTKE